MLGREETNIRLPECAFDALTTIATRQGVSRDEVVRWVLDRYLQEQEKLEPIDRLTHVSTVLRYPAPPRWRTHPRTDRPLRLRLPPGVIQRSRAVSLRLPGQSMRAHRDYQTRSLTDAVMTAIAMQEPFSDEFLDGLLPLPRQGAAIGLWQLAVAATSTAPENAVQDAAEVARSQIGGASTSLSAEGAAAQRRLLLMAEALDEEVAWHSPVRFEVAANIARDLLCGENVADNERLLYEQRSGSEWEEMRLDLRAGGEARARSLRGVTPVGYDWSGRGGAAVWRAERRVESQDFEDWLIQHSHSPDPMERQVKPPGWLVRIPDAWLCRVLPTSSTKMPEPFATWVATGQLLTFRRGDRQVLWPLTPARGPHGWAPAPGIDPVISAAGRLRPEQTIGFIEAVLVDWSADIDESEVLVRMLLPADKAFSFGLIDADERRHAMARARDATLLKMTDIINEVPEHDRAQLEAMKGNARLFRLTASRLGIKFSTVSATWTWPGGSVIDQVLAGTRGDVVQWLAGRAHRTCTRILQRSMDQAWHDAFDHGPVARWLPKP